MLYQLCYFPDKFFMMVFFSAPNSPLATVLTIFPTTSFLTIALRWSLTTIPVWEMIVGWVLLKSKRYPGSRISVTHASQVVEMHESPTVAIRKKKDSSIRVGIGLVKSGAADAFVSAGHSGVVMATSLLLLGTSKSVDRPAIATFMPTIRDTFIMLDVGANVDCRPEHLLQFAIMGNTYCRLVLGRPAPRVALLSIGEEDTKGNELTKEAFKLLKKTHLHFIGNIEGKDIFSGKADVVAPRSTTR